MGNHLLGLGNLPQPLIVLSVTTMVVFVTEFISNSATSVLLLPILANLVSSVDSYGSINMLVCRQFRWKSILCI